MNIPEKAIKCLNLALDQAATDGEWNAAAIMFCAILRKNGIRTDSINMNQHPSHDRPIGVMPFGKFKGHHFSDLPDWYVDWCLNQDFIKESLRRSLESEYIYRQKNSPD